MRVTMWDTGQTGIAQRSYCLNLWETFRDILCVYDDFYRYFAVLYYSVVNNYV